MHPQASEFNLAPWSQKTLSVIDSNEISLFRYSKFVTY